MSISVHKDGDVLSIRVSGEMTIYNAFEFKKGLAAHLFTAKEIDMDLTDVSEIDTAGLQLIVLIRKESMNADKRLRITSLSAPAEGIVRLYNMKEFLGLSPDSTRER